ncbi:hypothetical protein QAD02_003326 [Eretmocerus hayati]|uniref:Uncharacterized protein n=1 Tax=Eretmocerus hayati TaxID=131215 RepID=A0ACC2NLU2_9HYME|nr:hypothetical protein QAD02_003326 [Eretmocerus hayati]
MQHARKMVIVPEEKFARMQAATPSKTSPAGHIPDVSGDNSLQTVGDNLTRLDAEMDADVSGDAGHNDTNPAEESIPTRLTEESIIENLPSTHWEEARNLLRHWQTFEPDRFRWNAKGNVIIDGRLIPQSDITELLANVVAKSNKRGGVPIGHLEIAQFIGLSGTPVNSVGNVDILENAKRLTDPLRKPPKRQGPIGPITPSNPKKRVVEIVRPSPPVTRKSVRKKWLKFQL